MDYIDSVERELDLPSSDKMLVSRELRGHFEDVREALLSEGMSAGQAEEETAHRLGEPAVVAARLSIVHSSMSWKTAALTILPLILALLVSPLTLRFRGEAVGFQILTPWFALLVLSAIVLVGGCVRELAADRRPIWLATWLAGAINAVALIAWTVFGDAGRVLALSGQVFAADVQGPGQMAVVVLIALWAARGRLKLQVASVLSIVFVVMLGIVWSWYSTHYLYRPLPPGHVQAYPSGLFEVFSLAAIVARSVPMMAIAVGIFAGHRLSNAYAAALFVWAQLSTHFTGSYVFITPATAVFWTLRTVLPLVAVIFFARVPNWKLKLTGLCLAVAIPQAFSIMLRGLRSAITGGPRELIHIALILLLPWFYELAKTRDKVEIVR